jgi:hypothetical protein
MSRFLEDPVGADYLMRVLMRDLPMPVLLQLEEANRKHDEAVQKLGEKVAALDSPVLVAHIHPFLELPEWTDPDSFLSWLRSLRQLPPQDVRNALENFPLRLVKELLRLRDAALAKLTALTSTAAASGPGDARTEGNRPPLAVSPAVVKPDGDNPPAAPTAKRRHRRGDPAFKIRATLEALAANGRWNEPESEIFKLAHVSKSTYYYLLKNDSKVAATREWYEKQRLGRGPIRYRDV